MESWLASVVHLTDLHLLIEESGQQRDLREVNLSVRLFRASTRAIRLEPYRRLIEGFALHNNEAWYQLQQQLPEIVREERQRLGDEPPILVVQTGDVETFGRRMRPGAGDLFPAFKYLRDGLWPAARDAGADICRDLYGNHDVWAGTFPLLTPFEHVENAYQEIPKVAQLTGPWPDRVDLHAGGYHIELYRLNSVAPDAVHGSLASGIVGPHPPGAVLPLSGSRSALDEMDALAMQSQRGTANGSANRAIRIVAMHHPPHVFGDGALVAWTRGRVIGAARLAERAAALPVHLVLAGHRHKLDPGVGVAHSGIAAGTNQEPLPARTGQLAAASPTQSYDLTGERGRNSFSLYRLFVDEARDRLRVSRTVFSYSDSRQLFEADRVGERDVFREIPL